MRLPDERARKKKKDDDADLIDMDTLFLRDPDRRVRTIDDDVQDDAPADAEFEAVPVPQITRMPEGITVVEQQIGHAIGQWVFVIFCDCGRRWFSLHAQDKAQCPRCERWVHIDAEPRNPG